MAKASAATLAIFGKSGNDGGSGVVISADGFALSNFHVTNGGGNWVTPWGFPTKGKKTRKNKRTTKFIVASRHVRKKKQG